MKKIIVADDDGSIRDIFSIILKRAGYEVKVYPDGETLMRNEFELPDLFILDKQLSGVDGIEVCAHLKSTAATCHIPVIITSASPYVAGVAREAGADAFIEKPFTTKELLSLVNNLLNHNSFVPSIQL